MSFDLISVIKNVAPVLATCLGGPVGTLSSMAISAICSTMSPETAAPVQTAAANGDIEGAIGKLQDLFQQGALQTAQIKQAEMAHAEKMAELGFKNAADLEQIAAGDRDSARKREVEVKDNTPRYLAALVTAGFFACLLYLLYNGKPADGGDALLLLLGSLSTGWTGIMAYYFGSTSGSARKTELLAASTPTTK